MSGTVIRSKTGSPQESAPRAGKNFEKSGSPGIEELRRSMIGGRLTPENSLMVIFLGNEEHVREVEDSGITPRQRLEAARNGQVDAVILYCSDARMVGMDNARNPEIFIHIRVAGNSMPDSGASLEEIQDAVSLLKPDGVLVVASHVHCGAITEYVKWDKSSSTGSESLDYLLKAIAGDTPEENALAQVERASSVLDLGGRKAVALHYDWTTENGMSSLSEDVPEPVRHIIDVAIKNHASANAGGQLTEKLAKQTPHVMIVAADDLPMGVPSIVASKQNEVFVTTGSKHGLDMMDIASDFYAATHMGQNHIAFIAPGAKEDEPEVSRLFMKWESDLRVEPELAKRIDDGRLTVSRLRYDLDSGRLSLLGSGMQSPNTI
ncbi:MAG: carbonic anhydrase [Candidatus Micrarchaeota archaeon]